MLDPVIILLASLCGALLFGWSAAHKWRAPGEFIATVSDYRLLPAALAPGVAIALAVIESALCVAQFWDVTRSAAALTAAALLLLYAIAMSVNLARGRRHLDCGCGLVRRSIGGGLVVRNALLAMFLVLPAFQTTGRALTAADYATIVAALIVCGLLYAAAELLLGRTASREVPVGGAS
jgi:hypothetical protein